MVYMRKQNPPKLSITKHCVYSKEGLDFMFSKNQLRMRTSLKTMRGRKSKQIQGYEEYNLLVICWQCMVPLDRKARQIPQLGWQIHSRKYNRDFMPTRMCLVNYYWRARHITWVGFLVKVHMPLHWFGLFLYAESHAGQTIQGCSGKL